MQMKKISAQEAPWLVGGRTSGHVPAWGASIQEDLPRSENTVWIRAESGRDMEAARQSARDILETPSYAGGPA